MTKLGAFAISVLSVAVLAPQATPASAQTAPSPCTHMIESVPFRIDAPGYYCLKDNLGTSLIGGAIGVEASNVTVDCRGRSLAYATPENDAFAITGGGFGPVQDVTVRNCKIVDFASGIVFGPGSQRIQILNNDIVGARYDGIVLWASDSRVAGNRVLNGRHATGLDYSRNITVTAFQPGTPSTGNQIVNNLIAGASGNGRIWGIRLDLTNDALVSNNEIVDLQPNAGGFAMAIQVDGTGAEVINNTMTSRAGVQFGISGSPALCTRNIAIGLSNDGFAGCLRSVNDISRP